MSTLNFNILKGPAKMRDSFVGTFSDIKLIGENGVEVRLTEEISRKHPVLPMENHQARKIRLNGKDQTEDKDKWLAEDAIPYVNLLLRRLSASRRTEQSHQ
ncbi:hypothetical protein O181_087585 [Austropuccinia psidii MF-1]|uniref:Uncharacterized protein n=1 Tax=Austropuccinia psidii MF-1 TaxID=1389203 RepID=A0A9Q3IQ60_9BASI|nr:hypothetical protein [Austropuccinia psidii MF-1]